MAALVWDEVGKRIYESGVDRGVLYLTDGRAVAWNGLTSVTEKNEKDVEAVYFDGLKIQDLVTVGSFSGTISAVTYPDEFIEVEGYGLLANGVYIGDQPPKVFGLSYRTLIGNDVVGDELGYKLHVIYNMSAIPSDKSFSSKADSIALTQFEWDVTATPEEVTNFRPTSHVILDSRYMNQQVLSDVEDILYGSQNGSPQLLSLSSLIDRVYSLYLIQVTDNGDGSYTVSTELTDVINLSLTDPGEFTITGIDGTYTDPDTFTINNTLAQ